MAKRKIIRNRITKKIYLAEKLEPETIVAIGICFVLPICWALVEIFGK